MTVTATLTTLATQLHQLGDPATAETVTELAADYQAGTADLLAVLDGLDQLIAHQQVGS